MKNLAYSSLFSLSLSLSLSYVKNINYSHIYKFRIKIKLHLQICSKWINKIIVYKLYKLKIDFRHALLLFILLLFIYFNINIIIKIF